MLSKMYQTKPSKVSAWQATNSGSIQTGKPNDDLSYSNVPEVEDYKAGDWIVTLGHRGNLRRVFSDYDFNRHYEPVKEEMADVRGA